MSLPSCVPVISSNTKKDVIQNIPDSPFLASQTLNHAVETSTHQLKQRSGEEYEAIEAREQETCASTSTGSGEENSSLETILAQLPPMPIFLPDDTEDGATCTTTVPSTSIVHCGAASGGSSLALVSFLVL